MSRASPTSYLLVGMVALLIVSLPLSTAERFRGGVAWMLSPLMNRVNLVAVTGSYQHSDIRQPITADEHFHALQLENGQLRAEVQRLTELLSEEQDLAERAWTSNDLPAGEVSEAITRRRHERKRWLQLQLASLPARVVMRSPTSWNGSLWLNVGQADNKAVGRVVVAKNSPVVVGNCLVGVVDLVNQNQCRVRLITDSSFSPSVRAVRGDPQRQQLLDNIDAAASLLAKDEAVFRSSDERSHVLEVLLDLRERLLASRPSWYLAKGELHGSLVPLWRRQGGVLHGVGFNYDFADDEGPARELSTGRIVGSSEPAIPLLQVEDLLVTTGLDGVLPAGLRVAQVTMVYPLGEGDYFYELEARPAVGDMDALSLVSVLPPTATE